MASAAASALPRRPTPCVIDQEASHQLRGHPDEMFAASPVDPILLYEHKKCLVDESRGLKGMVGALCAHKVPRHTAEFPIYEWNQLGEGVTMAEFPLGQKESHISGAVRHKYPRVASSPL